MDKNTGSDNHQILQFYLSNQLFGIDIQYIHRVIQIVSVEHVPEMPDYFCGMINYHGQSIPVIDLSIKLHLSAAVSQKDIHTSIIICKRQEELLGFLAEKVLDLISVDYQQLQMSAVLNRQYEKFFVGNIITESGDTLILNIETLMNSGLSH